MRVDCGKGRPAVFQTDNAEFDSPYPLQFFAGVAQLVEQRTCNAKVEGSTPFTGTKILGVAQSG